MSARDATTWSELIDPIAKRFEVAAAFGADAVHNAKGAEAIAKLMREMARIIDDEIERRAAATNHQEHQG